MQKLVENLALKYYDKVVDLRHQIHMHPELEFEEENTAHLVCKILDEFGIKYQKNIAKTGILATIRRKKEESEKTKMRSFKSGYGCFACTRKN